MPVFASTQKMLCCGGLGFEIRIVARHVPLQPMRLQPRLRQDAMHAGFAYTNCGQLANRPVGAAINRLRLYRPVRLGLRRWRHCLGRRPLILGSKLPIPNALKRCFQREIVVAVVCKFFIVLYVMHRLAPESDVPEIHPAARVRGCAQRFSSSRFSVVSESNSRHRPTQ